MSLPTANLRNPTESPKGHDKLLLLQVCMGSCLFNGSFRFYSMHCELMVSFFLVDLIGGRDHNQGPTVGLTPNRSQERKKKRGVLGLDHIQNLKQIANTKQVLEWAGSREKKNMKDQSLHPTQRPSHGQSQDPDLGIVINPVVINAFSPWAVLSIEMWRVSFFVFVFYMNFVSATPNFMSDSKWSKYFRPSVKLSNYLTNANSLVLLDGAF